MNMLLTMNYCMDNTLMCEDKFKTKLNVNCNATLSVDHNATVFGDSLTELYLVVNNIGS